jgi:hypothetical protein
MSRYYELDDDDGDRVLKDGEHLRVPMTLMDSDQRDVRDHFDNHFVRDALARHNATGLHRPGYAIDALVHAAQPTTTATDASNDLVERRGMQLRDAFVARERALNEVERRQQWRTTLDARLKVEPEDDDGDDDDAPNGSLEQIGSGEYGRGGDHKYKPEDDENNGDGDSLKALQQRREAAYQESVARSSNAWRTAGPANVNQRQLEKWRGK